MLGKRWDGRVKNPALWPKVCSLIFSALADTLAWVMRQKGVSFVDHYIDDFITVGRPGSKECCNNLQLMLETCEITGTPVDPVKTEGPCTVLVFLGIKVDSMTVLHWVHPI